MRVKMKKYIVWLLVVVFSLSMALMGIGCKEEAAPAEEEVAEEAAPAEEEAAETTAATEEKVTLTFSVWEVNQLPAMETIANNFTKLHPNITIKVEVTPWAEYWMKLDTSITASGGADVFWMNGPNMAKYASNEVLLPLNDKIEVDNVDLGNYTESLVKLYNYKGEQYALPKDFDTIGLWYNKTLFDAAGIEYPDETWDWSTVTDAAEKLTDASKGIYGIAAQMWNQGGYYNTIAQAGGFVISPDKKTSGYDKPEAIAGLKFWTDLIEAGVSPTIQQMTDTSPVSLFESGKVAMIYSGSWTATYYGSNEYTKDKVDVAVLPKGVKQATIIHGLGYCINAKTKYPEEAWLFVQYLGGKEAAELQVVIPAFNGTQGAWVESIPNFNLQVFIDMLDYAVPLASSTESQKWWDLEVKYFTQAWAGEITVEDAANEVATEMNALLAAEK